MKYLFFIGLFVIISGSGKAQCIRVFVSENSGGIEIPIENREFDVTINDSIKRTLTTDKSGYLTRISLEKGKYHVKLVSTEFKDAYMKDVIVEDGKSSNIVIDVFRLTQQEEQEKLRLQKEKAGKK